MKVLKMFKFVIGFIISLCAVMVGATEMPQELRGKTIKYVVPTAPGSLTDVRSRAVLDLVTKQTGLDFVVMYKPGNRNGIGMQTVAEAKPDGLTIGVTSSPTRIIYDIKNATGFPKKEEYVPFVNLWKFSNAISADVNAPFNTLKEAVAYVKANRNKLNYAQVNAETSITIERLFNEDYKDAVVGIPMTTFPEAFTLMKTKQMTFVVTSIGFANDNPSHIKMLATTGAARHSSLPNIPTVGEFIPGFEMSSYGSVFAPKGVPQHILTYFNEVFVNALKNPELQAQMKLWEYEPCFDNVQQTLKVYDREYDRFDRMIKQIKIEIK
jgi:tripartite-type tricarboxylate transporter receptor subunit TctC